MTDITTNEDDFMYVSNQTVPESAMEDYGTKNKMQTRVRNLENNIHVLPNIFSAK